MRRFDREKYRTDRRNTGSIGDLRRGAVHAGARASALRLYARQHRAGQWRHHQSLTEAKDRQNQRKQQRRRRRHDGNGQRQHSKTREDIKSWFDALDLDDYVSFGGKA